MIHDLELSNQGWRNYPELITDTLWTFPSRAKGAGRDGSYHGNFIPQVPEQVIRRFTRAGDLVVDLFGGSGTTLLEAQRLGRHALAVDLLYHWRGVGGDEDLVNDISERLEQAGNPHEVFAIMMKGNSASDATLLDIQKMISDTWQKTYADHVILHPPYWDIVKFSTLPADLSNCASLDEFLDLFDMVARNAHAILKPEGFITLVIGDKYAGGKWVPLAFECMDVMRTVGFELRAINVKDIQGNEKGKGKDNNLWRYRALRNGLYVFKHEYVMIFRKERGK